jgi:ketosteroid isomerase-like protein
MERMRGLARNTWVIAGATLVVGTLVILGIVLGMELAEDDGPGEPPPMAVPTEGQDEAEVRRVIGRFVQALNDDDRDALWDLQTEAYKRVCPRDEFDQLPGAGGVTSTGPVKVEINGDIAGASIVQTAPDGRETPAVVPLTREADGSWRLAAPSEDGCT